MPFKSVPKPFEEFLEGVPPGLVSVLCCISDAVEEIADVLHCATSESADTTNAYGDHQLKVDVEVDRLIFDRLRACPSVGAASSEEQPEVVEMPGSGYTVAFDPLDGSSIVSANFSVGSIFAVWPGRTMVGQRCGQQEAAAYAVYGPRTLLVCATPRPGGCGHEVREFILCRKSGHACASGSGQPSTSSIAGATTSISTGSSSHSRWWLSQSDISIQSSSTTFAPANLRAAAGNRTYAKLVDDWIARAFTLRYTGGMVPDVHHILAKRGGVFCNPKSASAPAKLRLVYECAPLSFIVEAAGGCSHDGSGSLLERTITATSERTIICLGSKELVEQSIPALQDGA